MDLESEIVASCLMYVILDTDRRFEPAKPAGPHGHNQTKSKKTMHIAINHAINDPAKWEASVGNIMSMIEQQRLPAGLKPLQFLPSTDGRQANCVWEASSLDQVKQFVESQTSGARNVYFQVKADAAIGLPAGVPLAAHAA